MKNELRPSISIAAQYRGATQRRRKPALVQPVEQVVDSLIESHRSRFVDDLEPVFEDQNDYLAMTVVYVCIANLDIDERSRITAFVELFDDRLAIVRKSAE